MENTELLAPKNEVNVEINSHKMQKKLHSNPIESAIFSSDRTYLTTGVNPNDIIDKKQKRFARDETLDVDKKFQVYQIKISESI